MEESHFCWEPLKGAKKNEKPMEILGRREQPVLSPSQDPLRQFGDLQGTDLSCRGLATAFWATG